MLEAIQTLQRHDKVMGRSSAELQGGTARGRWTTFLVKAILIISIYVNLSVAGFAPRKNLRFPDFPFEYCLARPGA